MATNTVFILDDDVSVRTGFARLLRAAGHEVGEFASISEFLEAIDPRTSGCLVLDAGAPELADPGLRSTLMDREQLSIILISADDIPEERRKAQKMRAAGFFRKPVDGTALIDAIAWALARNI